MTENKMLPGCRVVDISDEKGWFAARLLGGLGAEVIRLDPPGCAPARDLRQSAKKAVSLDIQSARGRGLFLELVARSDVLIESFPPGYLKSLHLDYPVLKERHPGLIMVSLTSHGQASPSSCGRSSALTAAAEGGQLYLNGEPDREPLALYGPQAYYIAGLWAANGVLLALRRRRLGGPDLSGGGGQWIDISIQECTAAALDHTLVRYFSLGEIARRTGRLYWNRTFRLFRCRDGTVGLTFEQCWDTLVDWMDSENLAGDLKEERWRDPQEREQNKAHIFEVIENWTLSHSVEELVETGQLMRLPWAAVNSPREVIESPQEQARGYWVEASDPVTGRTCRGPGAPVKMSGSPWVVDWRRPAASEDNHYVYGELLGLSEAERAELRAARIID